MKEENFTQLYSDARVAIWEDFFSQRQKKKEKEKTEILSYFASGLCIVKFV